MAFKLTLLLCDNMLVSSSSLAAEIFNFAAAMTRARTHTAGDLEIRRISSDDKPVYTSSGFTVEPTHSLDDVSNNDLIHIPALWRNPRRAIKKHPQYMPFLRQQHEKNCSITAVGTGVCLLAEAGILDGKFNNASAIQLTNVVDTEMKRYDLMHQINGRGTYMVSKYCLPHLTKASNPHILNLSPPLDMDPKWFSGTVAYTMAKYTMSMCVLGMAAEFADRGIAVNALWPRTAIATAAVQNHLGGDEIMKLSRNVDIMADAAYEILTKDSKTFTGNFCIDDLVLHEAGVKDFTKYAEVPYGELMPDFFVPDDTPVPEEVKNS